MGAPVKQPLLLASEILAGGYDQAENIIHKSDQELVVITFSVRRSNNADFTGAMDIANIPLGLRPLIVACTALPYSTTASSGSSMPVPSGSVSVYALPGGLLRMRTTESSVKCIFGSLMYYTN